MHGSTRIFWANLTNLSQPQFLYVHEWREGDCVVYDNRSTWHTPTWHDAAAHERVMFRTTVRGNAGPDHSGPDSEGSVGFVEAGAKM